MGITKEEKEERLKILEAAMEFTTLSKNSDDNKKITDLLEKVGPDGFEDEESYDTLCDWFNTRITFGTAGLRGHMLPGISHMNDLIVVQTAQGIGEYINRCVPDQSRNGVVIGYDGRYNSRKWALMSANILIKNGHRTYITNEFIPTPYVAFATKVLVAEFGIMVTASHNPKGDNGYKVYSSNGAQIKPPFDQTISDVILENLVPMDSAWDLDEVLAHPFVTDPMPDLEQDYTKAQLNSLHFNTKEMNYSCRVRVTYTAMHGVGLKAVKNIVKAFGFSHEFLIPVPTQCEPDPEFSSLKFPNPEERGALDVAKKFADKANHAIILANDPDADRLAIAEKQKDGSWYSFTGNEIGALLGYWMWQNWREQNPHYDLSKVYMFSSTVSSKILHSMAKKEGFKFIETLTGFKWMGNEADRLAHIDPENKVIFAFEEAIGFMCGDVVLDKDGVGSLVVACELIAASYNKGTTLKQILNEIYNKYMFHCCNNGYYTSQNKKKTDDMFARLRNWPVINESRIVESQEGKIRYPLKCGPFKIAAIRDLTVNYDDDYADKRARLPISKSSHIITFRLECGVTFTLRTSGTEPKIKYYSEIIAEARDQDEEYEVKKKLRQVIDEMISNFYEPARNGFLPQSLC